MIRRTTGLSIALQVTIPTTTSRSMDGPFFLLRPFYPEYGRRCRRTRALFSTSMAGAGLAYTLYGPLGCVTETVSQQVHNTTGVLPDAFVTWA